MLTCNLEMLLKDSLDPILLHTIWTITVTSYISSWLRCYNDQSIFEVGPIETMNRHSMQMCSDLTRKGFSTKKAMINARRTRRHDVRRELGVEEKNFRGLFIYVYLSGQVEKYMQKGKKIYQ